MGAAAWAMVVRNVIAAVAVRAAVSLDLKVRVVFMGDSPMVVDWGAARNEAVGLWIRGCFFGKMGRWFLSHADLDFSCHKTKITVVRLHL